MTTKETVKALYDAFAEGNIPFILQSVSEDFTWEDPCDSSVVPYGGMHKGRSGFGEFFQQLGGSVETTLWEVKEYVSEGNKVAAAGRHGFKNKNTGKSVTTDWAMVWTFNGDTPVTGKAYYDTSAVETAFRQ
jgi:ketosteroid isomerase-like protein